MRSILDSILIPRFFVETTKAGVVQHTERQSEDLPRIKNSAEREREEALHCAVSTQLIDSSHCSAGYAIFHSVCPSFFLQNVTLQQNTHKRTIF